LVTSGTKLNMGTFIRIRRWSFYSMVNRYFFPILLMITYDHASIR